MRERGRAARSDDTDEVSRGYGQTFLHCIAALGRADFPGCCPNRRNDRRCRWYHPGEPLRRRELTDGHRDANELGSNDRRCGGVRWLRDRHCSADRRFCDRVLDRDGIRKRHPVEHVGCGREHVIGADNIRRIVCDRNGRGLDQCPGLALVSAGGSYGPRTLCRRDRSLLHALARPPKAADGTIEDGLLLRRQRLVERLKGRLRRL
jgi:hypothetical protein